MTVSAVRYSSPSGEIRIGRLDGDQITDAGPDGPRGFVPDAAGWAAIDGASGPTHAAADVTIHASSVPTKVLCIGLNYRDHAEESELAIPELPVVFAKWPSSLVGTGASIVLPPEEKRPDYEAELGIVVLEDVHARHARERALEGRRRTARSTTCPAGSTSWRRRCGSSCSASRSTRSGRWGRSVNADGVDLNALDVKGTVSGERMQNSNTKNFIFNIEELIVYVSMATTIEAGDVLDHRHARRRRRRQGPEALSGARRRGRDRGRGRADPAQPGGRRMTRAIVRRWAT